MTLTDQTAKHLHDIHFGGNWTTTNLKEVLSDVTWKEAIAKIDDFNSISELAYHVNYFVGALLDVLEGRPLTTKDKFSFDCPSISSEEDWKTVQDKIWDEANRTVLLIKELPLEALEHDFADEKYGSYYRNIHGVIEHMHYHLGQIVILKRLIRKTIH